MFTFFHRKKRVTVDCFTCIPAVHEYTPIVRASKTIPDWWKNLPKVGPLKRDDDGIFQLDNNMRRCYGFLELYKRGAIIESWTDAHFEIAPDTYRFHVTIGDKPTWHLKEQFKGGFDNYHHIKLMSPWHFREKSGMPFLFMGAEWSIEFPFKVLPGVVEYQNVSGTHINMMAPKYTDPYEMTIKLGQPLVHVIPLQDDVHVDFKSHLLTKPEFDRVTLHGGISYDGLRGMVGMRKRNAERKCPFGFG